MSPGRRVALSAVLIAAAGLLFATRAQAHLAWLALVAPALGALAARALPLGLALPLPLVWFAPLYGSPWFGAPLPEPLWGGCVAAGLYALGLACGTWWRGSAPACAGVLLLLTLGLALAPGRGAWAREPWPPALARALLDLSPTALALEAAGVDWMRHASVYDPVGSDRFERRARRGALAGPTLVLVGYLAAAAAHLASRRSAARAARA